MSATGKSSSRLYASGMLLLIASAVQHAKCCHQAWHASPPSHHCSPFPATPSPVTLSATTPSAAPAALTLSTGPLALPPATPMTVFPVKLDSPVTCAWQTSRAGVGAQLARHTLQRAGKPTRNLAVQAPHICSSSPAVLSCQATGHRSCHRYLDAPSKAAGTCRSGEGSCRDATCGLEAVVERRWVHWLVLAALCPQTRNTIIPHAPATPMRPEQGLASVGPAVTLMARAALPVLAAHTRIGYRTRMWASCGAMAAQALT